MPKLFRLSMLSNKEIAFEEAIVEGFEKLPDALNSLHDGKHTGKVLVRV